jgi:hypothetical protein
MCEVVQTPSEMQSRADGRRSTLGFFFGTTDKYFRDTRRPNKTRYPERKTTDESVQIQLSIAIIANNIVAVQNLSKFGLARVSSENETFGFPLHLAATFGWYDIVKLLLYHGAHVTMFQLHLFNSWDKSAGQQYFPMGGSAAQVAAFHGQCEVVDLLLKSAHRTSHVQIRRILHAAARGGHANLVSFVLKTYSGGRPFHERFLKEVLLEAACGGRSEIVDG